MNKERVQELYRIPKCNGHTVSVCVDRESENARMSGYKNGEYVVCNDFDLNKKDWYYGHYCYTKEGILISLAHKLDCEDILKSRKEGETKIPYDDLLTLTNELLGTIQYYANNLEDVTASEIKNDLHDLVSELTDEQKKYLCINEARDIKGLERLEKIAKYVIAKNDLTEMLKFNALKDMVVEAINSEDEDELNEADEVLKEWENEYGI